MAHPAFGGAPAEPRVRYLRMIAPGAHLEVINPDLRVLAGVGGGRVRERRGRCVSVRGMRGRPCRRGWSPGSTGLGAAAVDGTGSPVVKRARRGSARGPCW